ncbi:Hypothetical protein NTJ_06725 [Nesidiocoris tenuis]|uniref:Uncharacterized protein n=1 Tax=Nesidiocoris tenuis TaxID=355587 RepID=A0ABN7ASQ0_9HEMI|nr:Hypothetical protein NTJ_06725 [Nesidiocoris tenuis]
MPRRFLFPISAVGSSYIETGSKEDMATLVWPEKRQRCLFVPVLLCHLSSLFYTLTPFLFSFLASWSEKERVLTCLDLSVSAFL